MEFRELLLVLVIGFLFVVIMRLEKRVRELEEEVSQRRAHARGQQELLSEIEQTRRSEP